MRFLTAEGAKLLIAAQGVGSAIIFYAGRYR
jgi:hypothetical protein